MLIIADGQPKSGSTFLFRVLERLIPDRIGAGDLAQSSRPELFHTQPGTAGFTGFVEEPGRLSVELRSNSALARLLSDRNCVLKIHYGRQLREAAAVVRILHFFTYRDIFDSALALYDQGERERQRPEHVRKDMFAGLLTHDQALAVAIDRCRTICLPASEKSGMICLRYPSFIVDSGDAVAVIADACDKSSTEVLETIRTIDHEVRAGRIPAQFGTGVEGRGRTQKHLFSPGLVDEAETVQAQWLSDLRNTGAVSWL